MRPGEHMAAPRLALELMPYIFPRPIEFRTMEWAHLQLHGASPEWRLPWRRMKMRAPHIVPLSGHLQCVACACNLSQCPDPSMPEPDTQEETENSPATWNSLEPYAQIMRSLLPRITQIVVFDPAGKLRWSSETAIGPDLIDLVNATLEAARTDTRGLGEAQLLGGNQVAYVCWLRDDAQRLLAVVGIVCRSAGTTDDFGPRAFSFVHSLLRPALECLRRDLLARASIAGLLDAVNERDGDLELLLSDTRCNKVAAADPDSLKDLIETLGEHLGCSMAALIVPQKSISVLHSASGAETDGQLLVRTRRQLLSMAQLRAEPVIINRLAASPDDNIVPRRILCCPVRQASGRAMGVIALFRAREGSEFVQRDARLAEAIARRAARLIESQYDTLSGLYTRTALEQRASASIAASGRSAVWSVLYIDSDQLHLINDNLGMHVGDTVIGQLGELIRVLLAPEGLAGRISGDRFAVVLPMGVGDATHCAEALRTGAERLAVPHAESRVHVSVSIGIAPLADSLDLSHALITAEVACRTAKDRGRNRIAVYEPADVSMVRRFEDINVVSHLRDAIALERLRLDAQIIMPFEGDGRKPPHYELLLRMIGEDGSTVGPDNFMSAANRYQMMPTIDRWVLEQTIKLLKPHASVLAGQPAVFAMNLSGQSFSDDSFPDFLIATIEASGLDPGVLCFELTESAIIRDIGRAGLLIERLRRLGCGVALDDFGTGLSSLSYLRQLPVTLLKIDGSFVRDILKDTRAELMVRAITQLARTMSLLTVAEYVETEEVRARVAALEVDYGQGFAIGRPEPFTDVLAQLPLLAAAVTR